MPKSTSVTSILLNNSDWKGVFDQLDSMPGISQVDKLFYKALILEACEKYDLAVGLNTPLVQAIQTGRLEEYKAEQAKRLNGDPRRVAAMNLQADRNTANACRGFASSKIGMDAVEKAYMAAAAAGDLRAQARVINRRLADVAVNSAPPEELKSVLQMRPDFKGGVPGPLTAAERDQLMAGVFSGDPVAIRTAGMVLSLQAASQSVRIGPQGTEIGPNSQEVWTLVACDFGYECGDRNVYVSHMCAERGICLNSYQDYLQQALSGRDYENARAMADTIAEAIRRRDLSAIQLANRPGSNLTLITAPEGIRIR